MNTVASLPAKWREEAEHMHTGPYEARILRKNADELEAALASPTPSAPVVDDAIKDAAMRCARYAYGFWRGGSNGSWEALQYFDGGYVGRERDAAMYEAEIRAALSGVSAPVAVPDEMFAGDARNPLRNTVMHDAYTAGFNACRKLWLVSAPVGVEEGWALTKLRAHESRCGACGRAVWDGKDQSACIGFLAPCGKRIARLEDCGTADCLTALSQQPAAPSVEDQP